ncbi:hypothetical protein DCAR_0414806 [Daucus carota subsp. sativus]|uniref:Uncharacterized protein n=1 Tax=Daucus carota subsp. sativus TaxID=79200 RepID=A0A165A178_DAUCS|nr:hypothetical protein DCAR_0414806 [Daucus carota subsp. sativus]
MCHMIHQEMVLGLAENIEHHLLEKENEELGSNTSYDAKKSSQTEVTASVSEDKSRKKSEKKALKGWSNLRKIVLEV